MSGALSFRRIGFVIAAACTLLIPQTARAEAASVAQVAEMIGQASAEGEDGTRPLRLGSAVHSGETLRTGAHSRLKLLFDDRSVLTLGPGTSLTIDSAVYRPNPDPERSSVFALASGYVRAIASRWAFGGRQRFEVRTPTAVAGVRGTEFIVRLSESGQTEVAVIEGSVDVYNARDPQRRSVAVGRGMASVVAANRLPSRPAAIALDRLRALLDLTAISAEDGQLEAGGDLAGEDTPEPGDDAGPDMPAGSDRSEESDAGGDPLDDTSSDSGELFGDETDLRFGETLRQDVERVPVRVEIDFGN